MGLAQAFQKYDPSPDATDNLNQYQQGRYRKHTSDVMAEITVENYEEI